MDMKHNLNNPTLSCPTYLKHQSTLNSKKQAIGNSVRPIEKSILAEDIIAIADELLNCDNHHKISMESTTCHSIAVKLKKAMKVYTDVKKMA
jgi:hypothetical protein